MDIKEIVNKNEWEGFLLGCTEKTFLQSWNWGEFQKSLSNPPSQNATAKQKKIWRIGIFEHGNLISVALVIKMTAKRGSFLLVPHGPVINSKFKINLRESPRVQQNSKLLNILLEKLKIIAREEKADFVRISPIWERRNESKKLFEDLGFRLRPLHTHPESSWKLNIDKSEEELFNNMRKTTKYLIKRAQRDKDIEIFQSKDIKDIEIFNAIHLEVVKKQKFVPFSLEYFKKEFLAFSQDDQIIIFLAKYKGKVIAASYGIFWSQMAFYHHAGLLPEYRKLPVSYLLQWEAIKEAKRRGCKVYDFWGYIDPVKYSKHPYAGPTLFKMGFGGYFQEYVKTQDFIISKKYWLNYIIETIRRVKRGL